MPSKIRVWAAINPDGSPRLYPAGPGRYLGWTSCSADQAEHTISGAHGLSYREELRDKKIVRIRDKERSTSDMFPRGPDLCLRRLPQGAEVTEDRDIRKALRDGDLLAEQPVDLKSPPDPPPPQRTEDR